MDNNPLKIRNLVISLVDSIENKRIVDQDIVKEILQIKPKAKTILEKLIEQVRIYSIYDTDPQVINFDYNSYLNKIQNME